MCVGAFVLYVSYLEAGYRSVHSRVVELAQEVDRAVSLGHWPPNRTVGDEVAGGLVAVPLLLGSRHEVPGRSARALDLLTFQWRASELQARQDLDAAASTIVSGEIRSVLDSLYLDEMHLVEIHLAMDLSVLVAQLEWEVASSGAEGPMHRALALIRPVFIDDGRAEGMRAIEKILNRLNGGCSVDDLWSLAIEEDSRLSGFIAVLVRTAQLRRSCRAVLRERYR